VRGRQPPTIAHCNCIASGWICKFGRVVKPPLSWTAGLADVIVSGDEDLLVLHPFPDIPIVTPAQFLAMLDKENTGKESDGDAK
jgi:hypothetical protein